MFCFVFLFKCLWKSFHLVFFRQKVFEDVQRFLNTEDIINKVVFDLEDDRCAVSDGFRWFSLSKCISLIGMKNTLFLFVSLLVFSVHLNV